jgi:hypothetical protein
MREDHRRLAAMPGAFLLILAVRLAILLPALSHLGPVLVHPQPALQLLGAALLLRRRVPFALLLSQRIEFLLEGVITWPGRLIGVSHSRFSSSSDNHAIFPADRIRACTLTLGSSVPTRGCTHV